MQGRDNFEFVHVLSNQPLEIGCEDQVHHPGNMSRLTQPS